jgi:hypothetical protein
MIAALKKIATGFVGYVTGATSRISDTAPDRFVPPPVPRPVIHISPAVVTAVTDWIAPAAAGIAVTALRLAWAGTKMSLPWAIAGASAGVIMRHGCAETRAQVALSILNPLSIPARAPYTWAELKAALWSMLPWWFSR